MRVNDLLKLKGVLSREAYAQAVQKYRESVHKNPRPAAYRKRGSWSPICEAILAGKEVPRITGPVRVRIHTQRKHLPRDVGAVSYKALLDSIVSTGVLEDDNAKIVHEIIPTVSAGQEEYTEIIIEKWQEKSNDP
jgi:hypothetical protein